MTNKVFFVDKDGNEIFDEKIGHHVDLAEKIIKKDKELKKMYDAEYSMMSTANFLQDIFGYMRGECIDGDKKIIFDSSKLTDAQRLALIKYDKEGYRFINIYIENWRQKKYEEIQDESEKSDAR